MMTRQAWFDHMKQEILELWVRLTPEGQNLVMEAFYAFRGRPFPHYETEDDDPESPTLSGGGFMWPNIEQMNRRECAAVSTFVGTLINDERASGVHHYTQG